MSWPSCRNRTSGARAGASSVSSYPSSHNPPLLRRLAHFAIERQPERLAQRAVIVDHRRLVAAEHGVGLRARGEAGLDGAAGREVLAGDDVEHELQVLVPVGA